MKTTTTTLPTLTEQAADAAKQVVPVMQDYARELLAWLKEGKDFAVAQAPDLAKQIVGWALVEAVVWCVIMVVTIAILWQLHTRAVRPSWKEALARHKKDYLDDGYIGWVFADIGIWLAGAFCFITFWSSVLDAAKVAIAPKVYLVEYLSRLVK